MISLLREKNVSVADFCCMKTTGKESVNLSTVSQNLLNPSSALLLFLINHKKLGEEFGAA